MQDAELLWRDKMTVQLKTQDTGSKCNKKNTMKSEHS